MANRSADAESLKATLNVEARCNNEIVVGVRELASSLVPGGHVVDGAEYSAYCTLRW